MELKRVLLKLSGEALAGDKKTGFDEATVKEVARQVKTAVDDGIEVGIVIGGGNFWRGRQSNAIDRTKADQIGMLATVMNCIYVSEIFRSEGMMTQILTPFECGSMTKLFSKDRANKYFSKGMVVFFAGGTGHPYFSTDTGVALRAIEMDADCILLAKAIDGVYDGSYYAALIIPENFTEDMISFLGGEVDHPDIIYYENAKKNAIASKITQKAKTAVQEQVNSTVVSTLAETTMKVTNALSDVDAEDSDPAESVLVRLNNLSSDLQSYINILNSFVSIMNSAQSIVEASQTMLPNVNNMVSNGQASINSMESLLVAGNSTVSSTADMVSYSFDMMNDSLNNVSSVITNALNRLSEYSQGTSVTVQGLSAMMPYVRQLFDTSVSGWEDTAPEDMQAQINAIRTQLDTITADLTALENNADTSMETVRNLSNKIVTEIANCQKAVDGLRNDFAYNVKPKLENTMSSMQQSMIAAAGILDGVDADFNGVENALSDYQSTLERGSNSLGGSLSMAQELLAKLNSVTADLVSLQQNDQYQELLEIVKSNPEELGAFISSPVNLETVGIYEIENYGSAMSPFYTILALWVGALILVAIIHVKVHPVEGVENVKPYQEYFGRYMIFFLVGQTQTLLTVLGNLFYIKIQCHHPVLFWLAGAVASLVFTLFIYSLTVAFGNVGEALAIVVMVIQVAGAGGTFPIETLPKVYQMLYKYLPFPYGMNAMRETIGGLYKMDYWKDLGALGIYVLISLFIGLVVAIPFRKLNHIIEKNKEGSGVMI